MKSELPLRVNLTDVTFCPFHGPEEWEGGPLLSLFFFRG